MRDVRADRRHEVLLHGAELAAACMTQDDERRPTRAAGRERRSELRPESERLEDLSEAMTPVGPASSRLRQCPDRRRSIEKRGEFVHIWLEVLVAAHEGKAIGVELLAELARQQEGGRVHGVAARGVESDEATQDM